MQSCKYITLPNSIKGNAGVSELLGEFIFVTNFMRSMELASGFGVCENS